jgi:5-formyltetrahydrofolate cyclo-ligase
MTTTPKSALRAEMRAVRKALPDRHERSAQIWSKVRQLPAVAAASSVMAFTNVAGEPETELFIEWCRANGKTVALPEGHPTLDAALIDVVIVPGLAFTAAGDRLGQGGGWYDRFLAKLGPGATKIGVAFTPQIVDSLPVEPHDIRVDVVITA